MSGYENAATRGRTKYYQTSIKGEGPIQVSGQGIYDESSTQKYEVGTRLALGDGRVFYYCKNGAVTLSVGRPVQSPVNRTHVDDISNASAGDDYVTLASAAAAISDGDFDNGYMIVHDVGHMYKIRHSPTIAAGGSGLIYLYDPVGFATSTNDVTLFKNPCNGVIALADAAAFVIGVPLIAVTASYYFWCQTWGPCAALTWSSTAGDGTRLCLPSYSGTSIQPTGLSKPAWTSGVTGAQHVGYNMYDSTGFDGDEYELIYLTCMA